MRDDADRLSNIWQGDRLDRRAEADYLSGFLLSRYNARKTEPGFVLAVNAEWGFGKTFLLTKWCEQLQFQEHPVVYFDAWANDFTPEPLVAFIAELNNGLAEQFKGIPGAKAKLNEWLAAGKRAIAPTLTAAGSIMLKQAAGVSMDALIAAYNSDTFDVATASQSKVDAGKIAEQLSKAVGAALKEHINTRKAIAACREKLNLLIEHLKKKPSCQLPVYVVVDELDRCRPDYAIQLLEGIKHLFGVPGVYFIIGTNISQLAHSVAVVYGDKFDSESYLKRFFDLEYSLPMPSGEQFADELLRGLTWRPESGALITGFHQAFWPNRRIEDYLPFLFAHYAQGFDLSLRDQLGACRILDAAFQSLKQSPIHIHFLLFLTMLYQRSPTIYRQVAQHKHFGAPTEYSRLSAPPGAGVFQIKQLGDGGVFSIDKNVGINNIGSLYLELLRGGRPRLADNGFNFPDNLFVDSAQVDVSSYIGIVMRAGSFGNKVPENSNGRG